MTKQWLSKAVCRLSGGSRKMGWWSSDWQSKASPIIIGGCGRSGTTLLRTMLTSHPQISIGPETGVFCGHGNVAHLCKVLDTTGVTCDQIKVAYDRSSCMGEFAELICGVLLNPTGKPRWGDKSPCNVRNLRHILHFFPNARFVHMIRDGRDVVCSLRHHPRYRWVGGERVATGIVNPWEQCVGRWFRDTMAGLEWSHDPRCLAVRYESLVTDPRKEMERVLDFLGAPWCDDVLMSASAQREERTAALHAEVGKPVFGDSHGRWQRDLPPDARLLFLGGPELLLQRLGYSSNHDWAKIMEPSTTNPSSAFQDKL